MSWRYYDFYFKPSRPREAKGGIKAQSKRGQFGQRWWAKRWVAVLESFDIGARLSRGRSYARRGQVLSIEIKKGSVKANVQGSRRRPYIVSIKVKTIPTAKWKNIASAVSSQALFAAKLLVGEMPPEIEKVFDKLGLSLFPERSQDLQTDCSCPDWSNTCKHIAAVYYLLGEEFNRDPFLIFKLRGMSREKFVTLLSNTVKETSIEKTASKPAAAGVEETTTLPEPLTTEVSAFWSGNALPDDLLGEVYIPPVAAVLPKRLGSFPFWRGKQRFIDAIEDIYAQASQRGMNAFLAEREI